MDENSYILTQHGTPGMLIFNNLGMQTSPRIIKSFTWPFYQSYFHRGEFDPPEIMLGYIMWFLEMGDLKTR